MSRGPTARFVLALFALCLIVCAGGRASAAPTFPALTGRVVDDAHVLPAATVAALTDKLAALEAKTQRQLVVVTLPSLQGYEIEEYGYQLGRAWGIGAKGRNDGALFIVAPAEKKVRIEVGYGLEGVITDALSSVVLQTQVLPRFKAGDIPGGVVAGTDALIQQLSADAPAAQAQVQQATQQVQARSAAGGGRASPLAVIIVVIFVVMFLRALLGGGRRGGGGGGWLLPLIFASSMGRRSGGWGDDGGWSGGGGGGGGGGFSGGGGSFGGGGSSGSW